jgi:hypothetical protein
MKAQRADVTAHCVVRATRQSPDVLWAVRAGSEV